MASPAETPNDDDSSGQPDEVNGSGTHVPGPGSGPGSGTSDNKSLPSSSSPVVLKRSSTTPTIPYLSAASSAVNSPRQSREGSPTRPPLKSGVTTGSRITRSRKNSQDLSPIRAPSASASIPTVPSAAAIQRALSAAGTPHLPPAVKQDPSSADTPQPQKSSKAPISGSGLKIPRLSSPPPANSSGTNKSVLTTARKIDQSQSQPTTPTIVVDRPTRSSTFASDSDAGEEDRPLKSGMRTPVRGASGSGPALETVQESSLPSTPAISGGRSGQPGKASANNERPERIEENPMEEAFGNEVPAKHESGNESAGKKSTASKSAEEAKEPKKPAGAANSAKPPAVSTKRSFTQLPFTKASKTAAEGSVKNMTVETETVSSVPQVALGGGPTERNNLGRTETGGSVRLKPSTETIRPKKEKKKAVRKAPSLNAGNASTKADIFEAKIATAVDEANSSDSEETFVYESNPPEPHSARPHRFHSRTPSATSTASHYEGMKNRQDGHHTVVGKKSMKFANNYNSIGYANDEGTVRGPSHNSRHSGNTTPHHHHHIGRYGRGGHASLFDSDSPFTNPAKSPQSAASHLSRFSPKHSSPRSPHTVHVTKSPRKVEEIMSYDLEGEGADDERTPLIGSGRARNRRRPLPGSVRQIYSDEKSHRFCGRATAWSTLGAVLALIIAAIVAVVVLCSKPLIDVQIKDIRNVLASEQEIMLDLHVHAINPNLIAIQVSDLDVNIFAKSKHVGTNELWRSHRPHDESPDPPPHRPGKVRINSSGPPPFLSDRADIISQLDNVDEGTDPIDDPATDSQTMLLGQIFEFDSPLEFKPSPIHHRSYGSLGEVRLAKPGNRTEEGGSQRWEHVLQHDFELIARGVLRYSLPVSSRLYSAKIAGRIVVHPSEGIDESGNMRVSKPDWPFEPGSNVLLDPPHRGRGRTTVSGPT